MFSKSRRTSFNKLSRKNRLANHFSIEYLERREMFAADFGVDMAQPVALGSKIDFQPAAVAAPFTPPPAIDGVLDQPVLGATFNNGVLTVTGSNGADYINIYASEGTIHVQEVGNDIPLLSVSASQVTRIVVKTNGGDDWVSVDEESINVPTNLNGGAGNDTLLGGGGADALDGGAGDDRLVGNAGNDSITGGSGDDVLLGGDGNDSLNGNSGNDYLLAGEGQDGLMGEEGDDLLFGENGNDSLFGGGGQNHLDGGAGNDTIYGGDGDDDIFGGEGNDYIVGSAGNDQIRGDAGNDSISGGAGSDIVDGGDGDDTIRGDAGNDALSGGAGNDVLYGGDGKDWISGDDGKDRLYGEAGRDWLQGGYGIDTLDGGGSDDRKYQDYPAGGEPMGQTSNALSWNDAEEAWDDASDAASETWDVVEDGAEAAGNLLLDIGEWTSSKGLAVGLLLRNWAFQLPERLERLGDDLITTFSNWPWEDEFWQGLRNVVIDVWEIAGRSEFWQIVFEFYRPWQRGMTDREIEVARSVFGDTIDYSMVRLDEYSPTVGLQAAATNSPGRAFVTGYIINSWGDIDDITMIHELTHVWQNVQDGLVYMPEALDAQYFGEGYAYNDFDEHPERYQESVKWSLRSAALNAARDADKGLLDFNREQQGEIISHYFELRREIIENEADGSIDSDNRGYLEAWLPFVEEVSSHESGELRVPDPSAPSSPGDIAPGESTRPDKGMHPPSGNPGDDAPVDSTDPLGPSKGNTDSPRSPAGGHTVASGAREAVFAELSPTHAAKSPAVANLYETLDLDSMTDDDERESSIVSVITNPGSNCSQPATSSPIGKLTSSRVTTRAVDRVFGSLA